MFQKNAKIILSKSVKFIKLLKMTNNYLNIIKITEIFLNTLFYFSLFLITQAYADSIGPGGNLNADLNVLKDAATQWGATAAGICIIITGSCAVISLIIPWRAFKTWIGTPAWIGLCTSVIVFIILSFFGNSIKPIMSSIYQCPQQIIYFPCE